MLFLKLYDGYTEPIFWNYRWNLYRFYWLDSRPTRVVALCTLGMLKEVYQNDAARLRGNKKNQLSFARHVDKYQKKSGMRVKEWDVGSWVRNEDM